MRVIDASLKQKNSVELTAKVDRAIEGSLHWTSTGPKVSETVLAPPSCRSVWLLDMLRLAVAVIQSLNSGMENADMRWLQMPLNQ